MVKIIFQLNGVFQRLAGFFLEMILSNSLSITRTSNKNSTEAGVLQIIESSTDPSKFDELWWTPQWSRNLQNKLLQVFRSSPYSAKVIQAQKGSFEVGRTARSLLKFVLELVSVCYCWVRQSSIGDCESSSCRQNFSLN